MNDARRAFPPFLPAAAFLASALVPLLAAGPAFAQGDPSTESGERAVLDVVEGFHAALAAGDSTRALSLLHPDVVVYEAGHAETLAEYRSGHLAADMEFAASVERTASDVEVLVEPGLALAIRETVAHPTGKPVERPGTETMVLVPTEEGWRIRHIHWSSR